MGIINIQLTPGTLLAQKLHGIRKKIAQDKYSKLPRAWPRIIACHETGSNYTCDPPVTTTDVDKFVLVEFYPHPEFMKENGWEPCVGKGEEENEYSIGELMAYRKGVLNIILMIDRERYVAAVAATLLAKEMNLLKKEDRINIHRTVIAGGYYDGPLPGEGRPL